ncbi:MAG: YciI family protein [Pseudomonadota bacterium]
MKLLRQTALALSLATTLAATPSLAQAPAPPTYFLFVYSAGPAWKQGQPLSVQGLGPHGMYMTKLFKDGVVLAGGPSTAPEGGGLAIVKARDAAEAKALLAADPAIKDGIMTAEVRNWRPLMATRDPLLP